MQQRPYPVYALYDLHRFRILLLIPAIRLVTAVIRGIPPAIRWFEWLIGLTLIAYVVLKWWNCHYQFSESVSGRFHTLYVRQGIVCRRWLRIAAEDAASVEIERTPLLWLLGGRRVRVNTAGLRRRADVQLYLSAPNTHRLFSFGKGGHYRAPRWPIIVISLSGSNAAVGLLTIAPILRYSSNLLERFTGWLSNPLSDTLPPVLRLSANVLLIGWGVSAVRNFIRYVGFRARRDDGYLHLRSGWITRRDILIDRNKITALELRQTLTMRLFSLSTAVITAAGYGRDVGTRPVLVPAARPRELGHCLDQLLPDYPLCCSRLRPQRGVWRYVAAPIVMLCADIVIFAFGMWWRTVALVGMVFTVWWLAVRFVGYRQAGFGCGGGAVTVSYPYGLALYRVDIPCEVVDSITVTRSCFQRVCGKCTVRIRCYGEKKRLHRVWELPYDAVCREIEKL